MRIKNESKTSLPANRFDKAGSASTSGEAWEQVCYMDDRIGVNAVLDNITVGDLEGSVLEQAKLYNRNLSSVIGVTHSYKHMCSFSNMALTCAPNNDVYQREVSSDMEFAISFSSGFVRSNSYIPLNRGIVIKINLASDNTVDRLSSTKPSTKPVIVVKSSSIMCEMCLSFCVPCVKPVTIGELK